MATRDQQAKAEFMSKAQDIMTQMAQTLSRLVEISTVYQVRGYATDGTNTILQADVEEAGNPNVKGDAADFHAGMAYIASLMGWVAQSDTTAIDRQRKDF